MSFVSIPFALLLPATLLLLAIVRPHEWRKLILLGVSCLFYAYWDWRFLGLLACVTIVDYRISRLLVESRSPGRKKGLLVASLAMNLGFLAYFKYMNFFIESLNALLAPVAWHQASLSIVLPIGISFYIFETISYVVDVYRGTSVPARSLLDYAVFVTFFPRLVAGPIMRAQNFLPQLERGIRLNTDNLAGGSQLFLQGMVKKLVVADSLSIGVDRIYADPYLFSPTTVWLAVFAYSIQILCDFSGYTDMAMGIAKMMGFDLPKNFNLPYSAKSITDFWQRWHISLSSWLRDYLYIPLGGNRKGPGKTYANLMTTMLLGGLWHGASWNFVVWGGLHGAYLSLERLIAGSRPKSEEWGSPWAWVRGISVFIIVSITWVFFRSPSTETTMAVLRKLAFADPAGFVWLYVPAVTMVPLVVLGGLLLRATNREIPLIPATKSYAPAVVTAEALMVYFFAPLHVSPFIYFQF